ncbi:MAG: hypothetical protein D6698_17490 [Gammaproteobacteria bacterium]|nr:MAG: hypothetical protein D6698_17490 [Gammaproteobacteria bacterium]
MLVSILISQQLLADNKEFISLTLPVIQIAEVGNKEIGFWVEDKRQSNMIGKSLDEKEIIPNEDVAAFLAAFIRSDLSHANYRVRPYSSDQSGFVIELDSITYKVNKAKIKSTAEIKITFTLKVNGATSRQKYTVSTSKDYAWKPTEKNKGELLGEALSSVWEATLKSDQVQSLL